MTPLSLFLSAFCCCSIIPKPNNLTRGRFTQRSSFRSWLLSQLFWGLWPWRTMMWLRKAFILVTGKQRGRDWIPNISFKDIPSMTAFFHRVTSPKNLTISKEHQNLVSKPLKWSFWGGDIYGPNHNTAFPNCNHKKYKESTASPGSVCSSSVHICFILKYFLLKALWEIINSGRGCERHTETSATQSIKKPIKDHRDSAKGAQEPTHMG